MKLIFLGNNDPRKFKRGVENVIYAQSLAFRNGPKYYVFWGSDNEIFRWDNIICISIKNNWKKGVLLNLIIKKLYRRDKVIIHSHGPVRTLFCIYKTDILTVHDAIYYQRKGLNQKWYPIFYLIEKLAYFKCRKVHFISKYALSQSLLANKKSGKVNIIYNTTPLEGNLIEYYMNHKLEREDDNETIILLAVRGIQKRTRIDLLIQFAEFCRDKKIRNKKISILVAGKGDMLEYYRDVICQKQLNNIHLLGYVDDNHLVRLYNNCDIVILTCDHAEGFGLPIIEGYCCNKPVIGSNSCAVPEIIASNKYLFENNPESIFKTLSNIDNIQGNSQNFFEYYQERYSLKKYTEKISDLYKELEQKKYS